MRYTVILEPTNEIENSGWYYAHIPALDLTTHGLGLEGAMDAARDLVTGWIEELRSHGKEVPVETLPPHLRYIWPCFTREAPKWL
jgi:predicted RNase H-like HicB family nuclease